VEGIVAAFVVVDNSCPCNITIRLYMQLAIAVSTVSARCNFPPQLVCAAHLHSSLPSFMLRMTVAVLLELLGQGKRDALAHHLCQHRQQCMSVLYSTRRNSNCKLLCMQQAVPMRVAGSCNSAYCAHR
jgi:hypothetical protein